MNADQDQRLISVYPGRSVDGNTPNALSFPSALNSPSRELGSIEPSPEKDWCRFSDSVPSQEVFKSFRPSQVAVSFHFIPKFGPSNSLSLEWLAGLDAGSLGRSL